VRALVLVTVLLGGLCGCDSPPAPADLREWTPQDHDHGDDKQKAASGAQAAAGTATDDGTRTLVEATWRNQCASCHGPIGHGDGPSGPMVRATDLTKTEWQSSVTDPQIAASISNGKGKMPRFDLPPNVLAGLVARIRAVRGR
jgi:mono/diheme cytochrome c family protein